MKISELIRALQDIANHDGDLKVFRSDCEWEYMDFYDIYVTSGRDHIFDQGGTVLPDEKVVIIGDGRYDDV